VLPLDPSRHRRVAVVGRLADVENTGDRGSSSVHAPYVVTPLHGLRDALTPLGVEVVHQGGSDPAAAAGLAASADVAIVVAGYTAEDEGEGFGGEFPPPEVRPLLPPIPLEKRASLEAALGRLGADESPVGRGGDRRSLTLRSEDEDLILAVAAANPRTIVALESGSAVIIERWRRRVPAILMLWYPGMEGGHALADIVLGHARPTGRLPFAVPTDPAHLPPFDPDAATAQYGPLHGQRLLDHLGVEAAFPFGHGLTYA
jgi:beta-glucosidase